VSAPATILMWLVMASGLATPGEVNAILDRLGDADLVLMNDPRASRPVRVLAATRVSAPAEKVRQALQLPASYGKAMPAFQRVEVISRREREPGVVDVEVAWELEVPLWNLKGKLWLRPQTDGADLELEEGDLAPGLFHLTASKAWAGKQERSVLIVEGFANVRDASVATRELVRRSSLAEPATTVAAVYVMLKSLARLAEDGSAGRPSAAMVSPEALSLDGTPAGQAALARPQARGLVAAVRGRADGRLARVEVAVPASVRAGQAAGRGLRPELFAALPGWKKITVVSETPDTCQDPSAMCWAVQADLPLFSLDGTWKIRPRPWRARMVAGDREGAFMGVDVVSSKKSPNVAVVLSEHPRLDRAGYVARKLIAAEPYLEHGLALALTLVNAASLGSALERD
jgi:hypothetical protein